MQQQIFNMFNRINKTAFDGAKQLADINARTLDKLIEQQLAITKVCVEGGVKQMELARGAKDIGKYVDAQKDLAQEYSGKLMTAGQETVDILNEARTELSGWFEKGISEATSNLKTAAESGKKAA